MTFSPDLFKTALLGVFALLVVFAAVRDVVSYTIPNAVSAALAVARLACETHRPANSSDS